MNYYIETYGCQMNFAESSWLENCFKDRGYNRVDTPVNSDFVIINTCAVRKSAEERVWGRIGALKSAKKKKNFLVILTGCMAQNYGDKVKELAPTVDIVIGNFRKDFLIEEIDNFIRSEEKRVFVEEDKFLFGQNHYDGGFKAFVPIMHGCNNFCTYCIVPYVRGREISRSYEDIIKEIKFLEKNGVLEITLLGQNVNSYSYGSVDFPNLLQRICDSTNIKWIRFMSSHPKDFSEELIYTIKRNPQICNHIHLPVQHGSNIILKAMNRGYSVEHYKNMIDKLRAEIPDVSLTSDILIGFPGESEKDFEDTLQLLKDIKYSDAFTYYYNVREGTVAATMDNQIPVELKKKRLSKIIELQRSISLDFKKNMIGKTVSVLAESISKKSNQEILGRTENNSMVVFKAKNDIIGKIISVKILSIVGNTLNGEVVNEF